MTPLSRLLDELVPDAAGVDGPPPLPAALGLVAGELLGQGASGWVVRAHDPGLDRDVAVKIARPGAEDAVREEARITSRLAHPAVLPVHRVVELEGRLFVELRLAPSTTLAALLADWRARPEEAWPLTRRLSLLLPVAGALARAHAEGVVHGDLHPANLCVDPHGDPYVLDWSGSAEGPLRTSTEERDPPKPPGDGGPTAGTNEPPPGSAARIVSGQLPGSTFTGAPGSAAAGQLPGSTFTGAPRYAAAGRPPGSAAAGQLPGPTFTGAPGPTFTGAPGSTFTGAPGSTFTGAPGYAAPGQLHGEAASPASDVYALAAIAWELAALRPFRPRRLDEPLAAWVARTRDLPPSPLPANCPAELARLVLTTLERPTSAADFGAAMALFLGGEAERARRSESALRHVEEAQAALVRFQEGERRLELERRVATIQRAKVPGWAPVADKRAAWEAEDRAAEARAEQSEAWTRAAEQAVEAAALAPDNDDAHAVLAELWWERLRDAEELGIDSEIAMAARRVRAHDRGRWAGVLDAPVHVSLSCTVPGARATIARFDDEAVRVPHVVDERPLPLDRLPLRTGSWLFTVTAPGYAPARYPVRLDRLDHHRGHVELFRPEQIGEGWVQIPGGPFRMGGDRLARNAVDACTPTIGTRFVTRCCVTVAEYLEWLNVAEDGEDHVPSEMALFSPQRPLTARGPDGRFPLPAGWGASWPIINVSLFDAKAYADWRSAREGRRIRLLTEEEWEKAARGVDGRWWPWGNRFDPTFCQMRESSDGPPWPAAVARYPTDESVYGVHDTAGGMREWTTSVYSTGQVVVRGGTWGDDADDCRCAGRAGLQGPFRTPWVSFRLVSEEPRS